MDTPPVTIRMPRIARRIRYIVSTIAILLLMLFSKQEVFAMENPETILGTEEQPTINFLETQEPMQYTEEDVLLLATVIHAEAGICDDAEKYRVGNVVINRVNDSSKDFKNTIKEVIYQKGQFTSVGGRAWNEGPSQREIEIARDLLEGRKVFEENVVWFSKKCVYGKVIFKSDWHEFGAKK